MNDRHLQSCLRTGILLGLLWLFPLTADAADRPAKPMRETATLPADKNVQKRFGAIDDYLADKRLAEAIAVLQEIAQTDGRMLVKAQEGTPGESAAYLNVATRCNILLSQLPPEGLATYRRKVDPQAQRWLDRWKQSHDEADLQRIIREAYLSSVGDEALWALGESAWDRGDIPSARLYWTQLVPLGQEARAANLPTVLRYPDSDLNTAEVLARLILCTLMEGERSRVATELTRFQELVPDAVGSLAGQRGRLADLLKQIIDESSKWDVETPVADVTTFGLDPSRCGALLASLDLGASKWSHPLPASRLIHPDRFTATMDRGPLSYHPVTYGDIVLVNSARSIWAWNLLTGEPAWPSERGTAEIYPPAPEEADGLPRQVCSGVPFYTMTVADGRLYARMGSAVTNPAESPTESDFLESDLVCLDLAAGQGRLLWKIAAQELSSDDPKPWRFEGSPLVLGGRVYVVLSRRRPQLEFSIACLDAATGSLLWNRSVVAARGTVEDHHNRVSHLLLTAGAGKLFLSTDSGAIVALSASDGRLDWGITYESLIPSRAAIISSHLHQGLLPAMFHEGLLFVAPNDCNRLFCIEADSGRVRWQRRQPDSERWRHLLGVVPGGNAGRLIVSGHSLWSIDIATNTVVFGRANGIGNVAPVDRGYGRGVLAGKVVLWPAREAIHVVDATTGITVDDKSLRLPGEAEVGGNLMVAQGMLLVAQPERLVAYCEYSVLKKRLQRELSETLPPEGNKDPLIASPTGYRARQAAQLRWQLADLELAEGNLDAAINALLDAIEANDFDEDGRLSAARIRSRAVDLLRQSSRLAMSEGQPTVAAEKLVEARKLAMDPADSVAVLMDMAEVELTRGRSAAAIECWQQILNADPLCDVAYRSGTAGETAATSIARLITDRGPGVYAEVERRASREIAALMQAQDLESLQSTLRRYPNAHATSQAWCQLAAADRRAGRFHRGLAIYAKLVDQPADDDRRAEILANRAATFEAAGYWRPARRAWQEIAEHFADREIELDGDTGLAGELARQRLSNPVYSDADNRPVAGYLDRAWDISFSNTFAGQDLTDTRNAGQAPRVIVPQLEPPAAGLGCVLVHHSSAGSSADWECRDRVTGQLRWSRSLAEAPQWSAYSESHLLVATSTRLIGLALEDGRELWSSPLARQTDRSVQRVVIADGAAWTIRDPQNRPPPNAVPIRLALRGHWVMTFDTQSGVTAINTRTGRVAWNFLPPRGKLQEAWSCGDRRVALQTLQPATTWLIDVAPQRHVTECSGSPESWLQGPVIDGDSTVLVNADRRIECRSAANGAIRWRYQGEMSFAHVNPLLWSANGQLLLTVDGTTLSSISRATGRPEWSVGIAARPMTAPALQMVVTDEAAFAASHGLLRRISLKYGDCQWERYLGSTAEQWRVTSSGGLIAAWTVDPPSAAGSHPAMLVLCDSRTGRILQRIALAQAAKSVDVAGDDQGCLVWTDQSLVAFRAVSDPLSAASAGQ